MMGMDGRREGESGRQNTWQDTNPGLANYEVTSELLLL